MKIGLLNRRLTIQKATVIEDDIGNRAAGWEDYFSCACMVSEQGGGENDEAGTRNEEDTTCFTVRYCRETKDITSTGYRIIFNDEPYDIRYVNHRNYRGRSVKFSCRRVKDANEGENGRDG